MFSWTHKHTQQQTLLKLPKPKRTLAPKIYIWWSTYEKFCTTLFKRIFRFENIFSGLVFSVYPSIPLRSPIFTRFLVLHSYKTNLSGWCTLFIPRQRLSLLFSDYMYFKRFPVVDKGIYERSWTFFCFVHKVSYFGRVSLKLRGTPQGVSRKPNPCTK